MANRTFKDRSIATVYNRYRGFHLKRDPNIEGGNGFEAAYRRGFLWPTVCQYVRGSLAYAAWAAGVDDAREKKKGA